ncbi:probable ATP-dependent RNA helicase DDX46 isoform X2 [Parasteatoda tepidariorum]|uniref:probable ATP-dependent RNA helicase DDX46 isoform X2 n=1 Tax=Parasteatoda tepidariorum TaxID=114398 RepID=UPI00077FDD47|nr:probable ATP-dependent RNA helicase DDX46 isoform X2 [Parasteatoda tepidariorum]
MARDRYRRRSRSRSRSSSGSLDRVRRRRSRSRDRRPRSRDRRSRTPERFRRSRSRERRRSRSRSRDRERDRRRRSRSRGRDRRSRSRDRRERSRSRDRRDRRSSRDRSSKKDKEDKRKEDEKVEDLGELKFELLDKEAQNKQLELEMQKRRERIEKWRAERKKKEIADGVANPTTNIVLPSVKKWTLEDDDDEDLPPPPVETEKPESDEKPEKKEIKQEEQEKMEVPEDDVDPLDAFMQGIQEEVKQLRPANLKKEDGEDKAGGRVTMIVGMAKKKDAKSKGELMEQDQDALEYSSEEETDELQNAMSNLQGGNKAKKLLTVTKEDVTYQPFRKNFYVEVPELAKMTMEEVETLRDELEGIKVKGKGCPKPIKNWAQCGVSKKVMEVLKKHNYEKPTPIQAQAIPCVMSGRDMIGIAKTGSGKTLAFLLPMFRHILDQPTLESEDGPIAVIMTPTRELAMQITKECKKFAKALSLRVVCVYGGTGISEQIAELKRGAEVIVCTPGRMIDMLAANSGRVTNLKRCTYIVLDEADRMFDMGFEPQVMRIVDSTRPDRQTVLFSATFPRQMEALARRILTKPVEVQVGGRSVVCKEVEQHAVVIEEDGKFLKLLELLGYYQEQGSALVFVDKQENADMLLKDLIKASYNCMALHGGIDQFDRDSTICDFKAGKISVLIATSVAARGLDVKHLILVVNYDCPNHYEDYVHRCGRTGRAGNKGYAYTFFTSEQGRHAGDIIKALELSQATVPPDLQKLWDEYCLKQAAEGKKVKSSSGFSGKGFKFDEAEAQLANEKKKFQKAALGLQDSDDEDAEADIDKEIETLLAPKKRVQEITILPTGATGLAGGIASAEKLELAKKLASRISLQRNIGAEAQQAAEAVLKGHLGATPVITPALQAKTLAEQRAEKLHAKLNYQPKADEEDKEDEPAVETFRKYEEELEINDFPQQARWKVTSKEALAQISEYSEAGITVRGTYYPNGKEPKEGDRKLYLAIESTNELAVSKARAEFIRLIKEELVKMQHSYQPINRGRYKVL